MVIFSLSLSATACRSCGLSCDSPSVITIITFWAPGRPPRLNASDLHTKDVWVSVTRVINWVKVCLVPRHIDAQCRSRLLTTTLADALGRVHHLLHCLVLAQAELVDHRGAVLDHPHLQETESWAGERTPILTFNLSNYWLKSMLTV